MIERYYSIVLFRVDIMDNCFDVLFEDDDIVVVNKVHGLLVIPDRYDENLPTLKGLLSEKYGKILVVHRLDYGTGGVMVFARNEVSHKKLCFQFENGLVCKFYYAICKGSFSTDLTCLLPISKVNYHGKYKINFKSGRKAVTSFYVIERFSDRTLLKVEPHTGRSHQIRVHLKALKHPLFQDFLYNEKLEDKRLSLQAYFLEFKHPKSDKKMIFEVPLSEFMKNFLKSSKV